MKKLPKKKKEIQFNVFDKFEQKNEKVLNQFSEARVNELLQP